MQVGKKCNGASFSAQMRVDLEKPASLRIDPCAPLAIATLWSGELSEPAATFLGDIKNLAGQLDR
jgi:hypothetical protein